MPRRDVRRHRKPTDLPWLNAIVGGDTTPPVVAADEPADEPDPESADELDDGD